MSLPRFADHVDPSWIPVLESQSTALSNIAAVLDDERQRGVEISPADEHILRVLRTPVGSIRVLIVGQDPYPTRGHAVGWAFSTDRSVRPLPRSLANIYAELRDDLGFDTPEHGDLGAWVEQGVMLLNATLTVRVGEAESHRHLPWREVTGAIIDRLILRDEPLVAILWGNDAKRTAHRLGRTPVIESAHPSPLSARRGFFGSRPFSRTNALLSAHGSKPIDWRP